MDQQHTDQDADTAHGSHPGSNNSESGSGKATKWTDDSVAEHVNKKLRGQGKELKSLQEKVAAFEKADAERKAATQTAEQTLAQLRLDNDALTKRLADREAAEATELEEVQAENEEAIKALPKEDRELVPRELAPKALAKWLSKFRARQQTQAIGVHGGAGRGAAPQTEEEKRKALEDGFKAKSNAFLFGSKDKK